MDVKGTVQAISLTLYNGLLIKMYLDAFLERGGWKGSITGWGLFFAWEMGRVTQVFHIGSPGILTRQNPGWNLFTNMVVLGAVGLFSYTGEAGKRLLFPVIYVALLTVVEALVVFGMEYAGAGAAPVAIYFLVSNIAMLMLVLGIRYFVKGKSLDTVPHSGSRILLLFAYVGTVLYYSFYRLAYGAGADSVEGILWLCISALMLLALNLCIYPIYGKLAEAVWTQKNNYEYRKQIELYKSQRELERNAGEEIARIRHDLKQEVIYLSSLLRHQEYGKMKEVLDSLYGELQEYTYAEGISGNLALDSLVSHLTREAETHRIELDLDIRINGEMKLEDTELCALAGNLFDNAVEASGKIPEERKIWVSVSYEKGYLQFQVKNRYDGRIQREGKTIKSDKEGFHGFGLRSVKRIVHKYHGNMEILESDKIFAVKITAFC